MFNKTLLCKIIVKISIYFSFLEWFFFFSIGSFTASSFRSFSHFIYPRYWSIILSHYDSRVPYFYGTNHCLVSRRKGWRYFQTLFSSCQKISIYFDDCRIWTLACHCISPASRANALTTRLRHPQLEIIFILYS
jgi:hypothetical protein